MSVVPGQKLFRLTVLRRDTRTDHRNNTYWVCVCVCGREVSVRQGNLGKATKSCGCLRAEVNRRPKVPRGVCAICGGPKSRRHSECCRACRPTDKAEVPTLLLADLNDVQRELYDAIMRGRVACDQHDALLPTTTCRACRDQAGALLEVERATLAGDFVEAMKWWQVGVSEQHKPSSLALVMALAGE